MPMWLLRTERGQVELHKVTASGATWLLQHPQGVYLVPRPRPEEATAAWVGRATRTVALYQRLERLHALIPEGIGPAWARQDGQGPWIPAYGCKPRPGRTLAQTAEDGDLSLDLLWAVLPPVIELLRAARDRGLVLRRLLPEQLIVQGGRPTGLMAPDAWDLQTPDRAHDPTRVAAQLLHWFLCALRQAPGAPELPSTLWAICARGLEGGYAQAGLVRLEQDLATVARRPLPARANANAKRICVVIDVDGVRQATGAYLNPWLTLEALTEPGQRLDPVLAVHTLPPPARLVTEWKAARFAAHRVEHFGPRSVADLVRSQAAPGQPVLLVTGGRDPRLTAEALQRAGFPCTVAGFRCETEFAVTDGMERLKAALYLAAGTVELNASEGGLEPVAESV